jgi:hypothetical protein
MSSITFLVKDGNPVIRVINNTIIHHENAKGRKVERKYNSFDFAFSIFLFYRWVGFLIATQFGKIDIFQIRMVFPSIRGVIMSTQPVILHGQIRPDGTLQIEEKINLPPGPVNVTLETATQVKPRESTQQVLKDIAVRQQAIGRQPRTKEEIDAEIDAMRDEDEHRMREIEQLYRHNRPSKE